jgi:hypothetical protein
MVVIPLQCITLEDSGFHLLVEVVVLGRRFPAVLDTGASKTVLDKTVISTLMEDPEALKQTSLLSTGLGSFMVELPSLHIGEWKIGKNNWAVLDLSMINHAYSQLDIPPVIGVIGGDLLYPYGATIDYRKSRLVLRQKKQKGRSIKP